MSLPVRVTLAAVALVAAIAGGVAWQRWAGEQQRLAALVAETGLERRRPELTRRLRRHADTVGARLLAARAVLADELDPRWIAELPAAERDRAVAGSAARLAAARELAASGLASRPASWQAALVLGGATYLERARARDPRLWTEAEAWRAPLELAHRLAPSEPEPVRFLVAADLGNWARLSDGERRRTIELLPTAFADPPSFGLLADTWLNVAPSFRAALEPVPDQPDAWRFVEHAFARRDDWERVAVARNRLLIAARRDFARRLDDARERLAGGAATDARRRLLELIAASRPEAALAASFAEVLTVLPPGPLEVTWRPGFRRWLDWSIRQCLAVECPLPASAFTRLGGLLPDLEPELAATALLLGGDPALAAQRERRAPIAMTESWAPYQILRARELAARGDAAGAGAALALVHPTWAETPAFLRAQHDVGLATGDARATARAAARLEARLDDNWPAAAWWWTSSHARLELATARAAEGVEIEMGLTEPGGVVIDVWWDGELAGAYAASPGRRFRLERPVAPGPHLLELTLPWGTRLLPGPVRLLPHP